MCLLVVIGVRADGRKELVALADGFRESTESWADLLRDARRRGMAAPVLAVGDGALGFWKAVREVFPETREQRCWFHKIANVLNALPKSAQTAAKAALAEIYAAEDKTHAAAAARSFAAEYGVKWPKAAAKITDDLDVLLGFYDFPAEHWIHLRTTNPIESTFATVRLRTRGHQGPRQPRRRRRDGVQADRVSPDPLARRQRTPLGRPGPRRRHLRQRPARRTTRPTSTSRSAGGVKHANPQVLTIPRGGRGDRAEHNSGDEPQAHQVNPRLGGCAFGDVGQDQRPPVAQAERSPRR